MSFSISKFKTTFDKYGGPARPNLFEVIISKPQEPNSNIDPTREFSFFCNSVNFPGIGVETGQFTAVSQLTTTFPLRMQGQPISANFMLDSNHQILSFFHNWMQRVMNYSTKGGPYASIDDQGEGNPVGMLPYELGYKDDYGCRMIIRHYSTESFGKEDKYYEVTMENVFPTTIQDVALDWGNNDQLMILPVSFAYDRIWYSNDRTGNPSVRTGGGFLDTLSDLAKFVDVTKQTINQGKITSIQDAINRLNRVRNSYDNLSSFFTPQETAEGSKENKPAKDPGKTYTPTGTDFVDQ